LFIGLVAVRPACNTCGLGFRLFDTRVGPAALLVAAIGIVAGGASWLVNGMAGLSSWAWVLPWPLTIAALVLLLRPLKATLIAREYRARVRVSR